MAENYVVNYDINVRSQQALDSIRKFQEATKKLDQCGQKLKAFQRKIESVHAKFSQMAKKAPVIDVATSKANQKLDRTIAKLERIHSLAKKTAALNISASTTGKTTNKNTGKTGSSTTVVGGSNKPRPNTPHPSSKPVVNRRLVPRNISYRNLGPTMLDSGGIGAFNMVKGMGIAYGIAGLGSLMGNVGRDATEYDNLMQTTKNILQTHDKLPGFNRRFQEMAHTVRNVGVETKFTAPQVADASKFLAMAGFDIDAINKSIRPISDIALVGDTDLGETADVVTNIMTGYGISPEKIRRASDVMTMTFTKSNTTLLEIAEAYKYSASLLSAGGVSFEEATAALGVLGDAGVKGSQAGTTMRTIIANLVNPTKKQLKQWDEIGVDRLDENGRLRPLTDIFGDLNKADLEVSDFYKMFHKTSAQGAVSLTNNVDKWNEIVYQNFLSDGLVGKLAEEKKNTIQGLWYQLTSMFTEDGMQAFEELQQPIKDMLNQTINWLKTPEAVQTIKQLSKDFFELISMLKDFALFCIKAYNSMSWFIKPWLKFQVIMWPILSFFRAFKALGNMGMYIFSLGAGVTRLAGAFAGLLRIAKAIMKAGVLNTIRNIFTAGWSGVTGTFVSARANTAATVAQLAGVATPATVAAGNATTGAVAGATAAGGKFLAALPWLGAAAAVGVLTYGIYSAYSHLNDLSKAYDTWYEKVYSTKGYLSEGLSPTERYLKLVHDKQLSANQKVEEYIRLRRIQIGLESEATSAMEGKKINEVYKDKIKSVTDHPWHSFLSGTAKIETIWEKSQEALDHLPDNIRKQYELKTYSYNGQHSAYLQKNGQTYNSDNLTSDVIAATIGWDAPQSKEVIEEFTTAFKQSPIEEWGEIRKRLELRLLEYKNKTNPEYNNLSLDKLGGLNSSEILSIPLAYESFANRIFQAFDFSGDNENAKALVSLQNLLKTPGEWGYEDQVKALANNGVGVFKDLDENLVSNFTEWTRINGFDPETGRFVQYGSKTADYWAQQAHQVITGDIVNFLSTFNKEFREKFTILSSPFFQEAYAHSGQIADKEPQIGQRQYINGIMSEYRFNGPTGKNEWVPVVGGAGIEGAGGTGGGFGTGNGTGATGTDQSKYKSHYNSGSAAPKQIIVKIENLMNVKSIDLTNSDNSAAIDNIKGQLTQALIDAVHDFDDTFHG
ncbi:phage tail tape measure protein [Bacteroides sp. 224]|uniref:phage tail tape measure protein n=1 Tax=Bacteroides sp. 224 TaxID=2302936 RepID=UPI0013D48488|nr:phage tail tape measure protein [Bacteroides sp. 224]NDV63947.1 phage tail tape measure protein [Bacteroides sp. 224]